MDRAGAEREIAAAASRYGVPLALAHSVAYQESRVNPNVGDGRAGEIGIFQLMPATAAWLGVSAPRDPVQNIDGGVRFLAWLLQKYGGDTRRALEAYNGGPGNVDRGTVSSAARLYASQVMARAGVGDTGAIVASSRPPALPGPAASGFTLPDFRLPDFSLPAALREVPVEVGVGVGLGALALLIFG